MLSFGKPVALGDSPTKPEFSLDESGAAGQGPADPALQFKEPSTGEATKPTDASSKQFFSFRASRPADAGPRLPFSFKKPPSTEDAETADAPAKRKFWLGKGPGSDSKPAGFLMPRPSPTEFRVSFHFGTGTTYTSRTDVTGKLFNSHFPADDRANADDDDAAQEPRTMIEGEKTGEEDDQIIVDLKGVRMHVFEGEGEEKTWKVKGTGVLHLNKHWMVYSRFWAGS
jgi:hypothetical protein